MLFYELLNAMIGFDEKIFRYQITQFNIFLFSHPLLLFFL